MCDVFVRSCLRFVCDVFDIVGVVRFCLVYCVRFAFFARCLSLSVFVVRCVLLVFAMCW